MILHFGPLRCALEGPDDWLELARARYGAFVSEGAIEPSIRVVYRTNGRQPSPGLVDDTLPRSPRLRPSLDDGSADARSEGVRSEGVWHFDSPGVEGRLAPDRIDITGPLATYPLDAALIAIWTLAAGRDAVVVHGALLADGDRGWLCTGPSGVGKSTLAELLPEQARCDELVGIRRETLPGGSELVAYSLPFWRGRPCRVALEGVHFLCHAQEHRRLRLSPTEAFARLRSQILWPGGPTDALAGAFRTVTALAELPCHDLGFRPDRGVWHHVRKTSARCLALSAGAAA